MKQIVIISGKGGTGKTVLTSAFASLAKNAVFADCDVDAADLHLLLNPEIKETHEFKSGFTAVVNKDKCVQCGLCKTICRFDAITDDLAVDPVACEGCSFCKFVCPNDAIKMEENLSGHWFSSDTRFGPLVHAKLGIAEENSGKLVTLVRNKAKEKALEKKADFVVIDGSPGIGCPVIASISGVDCAVVVTEPTISGLHDASRVVSVAKHFQVPVAMIINKYDLNEEFSKKIENYCNRNNIPLIGKIGFEKDVVKALVEAKTIIEYSRGPITENIKNIWQKIEKM